MVVRIEKKKKEKNLYCNMMSSDKCFFFFFNFVHLIFWNGNYCFLMSVSCCNYPTFALRKRSIDSQSGNKFTDQFFFFLFNLDCFPNKESLLLLLEQFKVFVFHSVYTKSNHRSFSFQFLLICSSCHSFLSFLTEKFPCFVLFC